MGIIASCTFRHETLGETHLRVIQTARNVTARVKSGVLHVSAPPIDSKEFLQILQQMSPKLLPKIQGHSSQYFNGFRYDGPEWSVSVHESNLMSRGRLKSEKLPDSNGARQEFAIYCYPGIDYSDKRAEKCIASLILGIAKQIVATEVIPLAAEAARRLGLTSRVTGWEVGRGRNRLGCCYADGRISLSPMLAFHSRELRLHTITHELAHLSHFDHSPAFHAEWRRLFGAPTAPATRLLKGFKYPV